MKKIFFIVLLALNSYIISAQLVIDNSTKTPQALAQNVLLGNGINISNITFNKSAISASSINDQIGEFSNGTSTNIGIDKGIILSTGNSLVALGPNDTDGASSPPSNIFIGDADLYILSNYQYVENVAILEFDFVPTGNKLNFNFVFASEEYPKYVDLLYNDCFGFFLSGPGITGPFSGNSQNLALIPNTNIPISISNLNNGEFNSGPCKHCQYYNDNTNGTTIQYNGFTKVLNATANLQCGQTYHIKLAIANVLDDSNDSAVFIEASSFSSTQIDLGKDLKLCSVNQYQLDTGLTVSDIHQWTLDGQIIPSESKPTIIIDKSGTYGVTVTPLSTGCPVSDEIKIVFDLAQKPQVSCGTKTSNSIQFNWLSIPNITDYSISYKIGINPEIQVGAIGNVNFYTVAGVTYGETVVITVTPIGGTPADCFKPNSISCIFDYCAVSPTISLSQGNISQQICKDILITDIIFTIGGGATNASVTSVSLPTGLTTSLVGDQFTIKGIATNIGIFNYTIFTSGGCGANASISGSITVNPKVVPTFNTIAPICSGETIAALPTISNNTISGTWTPALNNLATTEYTFTPNTGQCANDFKFTINVNPKPIPSLADGMICIDKNTNKCIKSYVLDSKLNSFDYDFEWFLDGNAIINAIGNRLETIEKGVYSVIATNKTTNCPSTLVAATVTETFANSTVFKIEQTNNLNDAATITILIAEGKGNFEYQLDSGPFQTSPVFSEVAAGSHVINIVDVNGCDNVSKEIIVIGYPKFFTPNGDDKNDTWNIIGFTRQSNAIIYIFDRYGKLLKQISSNGTGWDGTYNVLPLPSDDYWFQVTFLEGGILKEFKSHFSLKR